MSRTATQVWERLRKMHYRGDNPLLLSVTDFAVFLEEVNKQREEKGNSLFTRNDVLMYKERQVLSNPEVVIQTRKEDEPMEEKVPAEEKVEEEVKEATPVETHSIDELIPTLRMRK